MKVCAFNQAHHNHLMESGQQTARLEKVIMGFHPMRFLPKYVQSVEDIYEERADLKVIRPDEAALDYVLSLVVEAVAKKRRFRQVECLKVVRRMVKGYSASYQFSESIKQKLFYLFQQFVAHRNEDVARWVNVCIKGQRLTEEQVDWLILNVSLSAHVLNRLLRYPERNTAIRKWAREVLQQQAMPERTSELIGLLIDKSIPAGFTTDTVTLAWAVYYSKATDSVKERLLCELLDAISFDTILTIAQRNGYVSVIEFMLLHTFDNR